MKASRSTVLMSLAMAGLLSLAACTKGSDNPSVGSDNAGASSDPYGNSSDSNNGYGDSKSSPAAAATAAPNEVIIQGAEFRPTTLKVASGTTITWTNKDSYQHTVTSDDGKFDFPMGPTATFKFDSVGTFKYHCKIHSNMHGEIDVT